MKVKMKVAQSYRILCDPKDCSLPGSSVHGILQARTMEWVARCLLQGIFPTQGWNPSVLHCRQILYHLSHWGSPRILEWAIPSQGHLPHPGIEGDSAPLQADSLPAELIALLKLPLRKSPKVFMSPRLLDPFLSLS